MKTNYILPALLFVIGCGSSASVPDVAGAAGSAASNVTAQAQGALGAQVTSVLSSLKGKTLADTTGALGGGDWTIGDFGVVKDVLGGKDPVLALAQNQVTKYLPIGTEGDAADLVTRVTGSASSVLKSGALSDGYSKALGLLK